MKNLFSLLLLLAACWGGIVGQGEPVKNCPQSCHCELTGTWLLTIRDCLTEPSSELYKVLQEHRDIQNLKIINASLSSIGDISYLSWLQYLNLTYNHLTALPCELSKLSTLRELYISHNDIQTVGCDMSVLNSLDILGLGYNKLKSLPCELFKGPRLSELDLSHNDIQTLDCDMSEFNYLETLYLNYNKLKSVASGLPLLPKLSYLDLSHNDIQTVDSDMSELKDLKYLYLTYNKMKSMPCELSKVPKLAHLYLSHNDIQTVDCDMSEFQVTMYVHLDYNKLKSVPCKLSKIAKLSKLYLSHNDIHTVDCDMSELKELESLYLDYNKLKSVPCELSKVPRLVLLSLAYNEIQTVDCDMSGLKELAYLNLDYNKLKSMPCALSKVPHLIVLDLGHNDIQKVRCDMSEFKGLIRLFLDYNNVKSIPCELSKLPKLKELHLSHNDIQTIDCDMSEFKELINLFLGFNKLKSVPCELSKLSRLFLLDVAHNDIQKVGCDMSGLKELKYVVLDNNKLKSMPCEFSKGTLLIKLFLAHNDIQIVDCDMSGLKELQFLRLDYNKLESVPCELSNVPKLRELHLSHNNIKTVDCAIKLSLMLDLSYNKLTDLPLLEGIPLVNISNNAVSHFTNKAGLNVSCGELPTYYLQNNNISHLMDIFVGWNLTISGNTDFPVCIKKLTEQFIGNPLICNCKDYRFYLYLQVNAKVWNNTCNSPFSLKGQNPVRLPLDQFVCQVTEKCPVGCSCVSVPHAQALRISCKAYKGVVLPKDMPALQKGTFYELYLRESHLTSLPLRPYFNSTTKAIFSHSYITKITIATLKALSKNIKILHLNNNELQSLPADITMVNFKSLVEVRFDNNPWNCGDCHTLGLRDFVMDNYHSMKNPDLIKCQSPTEVLNRRVTYLARSYFCQREARNNTFTIIIAATTGTILLTVSVAVCIKKRKKVKVKEGIPVQQQNGVVIEDEADDEGRQFDIFVSYATDDEEYAGEWLIPELESRGFKVCFHRVHFLGGVPIHVNMYECISKSKRMLAFFSKNFLESKYSMYEFDLAYTLDIDGGTKRLVTIKEAALDIETIEQSYGSYFRTHTYIEEGAVNFWENLLETMPRNKLGVIPDEHVV